MNPYDLKNWHHHDHLVGPILCLVALAGAAFCIVWLIEHMRKRRAALAKATGRAAAYADPETLRKARLAGERARQRQRPAAPLSTLEHDAEERFPHHPTGGFR